MREETKHKLKYCNHKWRLESATEFSGDMVRARIIKLFICEKCGLFKKIRID